MSEQLQGDVVHDDGAPTDLNKLRSDSNNSPMTKPASETSEPFETSEPLSPKAEIISNLMQLIHNLLTVVFVDDHSTTDGYETDGDEDELDEDLE
jgi:hypothetical protein